MVCLLSKDENGELTRIDLHPDEVAAFSMPEDLLGCWTREVNEDEGRHERDKKIQAIASSEELFLSLFDGSEDTDERSILKQLLALMLERKRILRPITTHRKGLVEYLHVKTKTHYVVNMHEWEPKKVIALQEQLSMLLF